MTPNQYIKLSKIKYEESYNQLKYTEKLNHIINIISNNYNLEIFNEKMSPVATPSFNIFTALKYQCFEIETSENHNQIISCNPHNKYQQNIYANWKLCLTTPHIFLIYLANQLSQNTTLGMFQLIHLYAKENNISDIHISSQSDKVSIQFSSTGKKTFDMQLSGNIGKKLIHYIKLISQIEPSITTKPQDGSYKFSYKNKQLEIRSATLPIFGGEMISLRLFHPNNNLINLEQLGFSEKKITAINQMITAKHGLILITGATGSGKSTTLYTILRKLIPKHIITIEDPIEQVINGTYQTNINTLQNYTLNSAFKAALRHNPDVIAIGEIRDQETAEVVLNAAYSGHLVLASLHTNNIESTLLRLSNLGCNPFLISYCLRGIISQELSLTESNKIQLTSSVLYCKTPYIIHNLKEELTEFIAHNTLIE